MLATTLIYLSGLGLCILAGVALSALVEPRGRWHTPATPAAGAAFIVVLLFGFLLPGATAATLACIAIAALLALAAWRRPRGREKLRAALVSTATGRPTYQTAPPVAALAGGGPRWQVRLGTDDKRVRYRVSVPAGRTARVTLDPSAPVVAAAGTLTPLLVLTRVEVD